MTKASLGVAIIGAGLSRDSLTEEASTRLKDCALVFLVNLDPAFALESPKGTTIERLNYDEGSWNQWERGVVRRIVSAFKKSGTVAVLLPGHSLAYSLGPRICALCARLKIPYQVLPGLSDYNEVLALVEPALHGRARRSFSAPMLICGAGEIVSGDAVPRAGLSTIAMNLVTCGLGSGSSSAAALRDKLAAIYGSDWRCFLVDAGVRHEDGVRELAIKELGAKWDRLDSRTSLFIPFDSNK